MTLLPIPSDCIALEELPPSDNPKGILMELLGSLQHPYIYPVLDLGFLQSDSHHYACLVMPFNNRGSLKDLIYKVRRYQIKIRSRLFPYIKYSFIYIYYHSHSGMSHRIESIHESQHVYHYHKFNDWVDKFWKL